MSARDLIVIARRRAGLSQRELADRLARPQATVARWESGAREPSFAAVQQVLKACGLQQLISVATYDDSDVALAHRQLTLPALERVAALATPGDEQCLEDALAAISNCESRLIVIGDVGAALQGSPVIFLSNRVDVVAHADDRERAAAQLCDAAVVFHDDPPGTRGYGDLARSADRVALDDGHEIGVAGLHDLLRIALSDRSERSAMSAAIGLDAALRARHAQQHATDTQTRAEAVQAIERWLDQQTPLAR
jgi:transcriptional regulator with XRE-family HTH domain